MADSSLNTSKITDYFPPSPCKEADGIEDPKPNDIKENIIHDLSNSSVIITPQNTPEKDNTSNPDDKSKSKDKDPGCKKELIKDVVGLTKDTTKDTTATKNEETKGTSQTKRPKSRRKGRKKKETETDNKSEVVTNGTCASGPAKPKAPRKKKVDDGLRSTLLTDYFPVRRSDRRNKSDIQKEKETDLEMKIINGCEDGLKIEDIENKGRGVIATKKFLRNDFVVEYAGDLISIPEANERDTKYSKDPTKGCYMYYFQFKNKKYCIDATSESGKLGRLLNHSKTHGNCHTKLVNFGDRPYLILVASRDINIGEELLYDYGDRSRAALESHPWLKS
ncbi:histone H4-K20 monomethylation [Mactra antiquata]